MQQKTWIIVANNTIARFFSVDKEAQFKEIETLVHPEGRLKEQDLTSDRPGRGHESMGPGRHAVEPKVTAKKQSSIDFAKLIAKHLESGRSAGSFDRLYVAANATFLGLLRQELSKQTSQLVEKEVDKDIIHLSPSEIREYFRPA